jgi:hypothetical protein
VETKREKERQKEKIEKKEQRRGEMRSAGLLKEKAGRQRRKEI